MIVAPTGATRPRVAYAVGKTLGPAVTRNRVRRRLRHAFSQLEASGRLPPADYLVIASPATVTLDWASLLHHTETAIATANLNVGTT